MRKPWIFVFNAIKTKCFFPNLRCVKKVEIVEKTDFPQRVFKTVLWKKKNLLKTGLLIAFYIVDDIIDLAFQF